MSGFAQQILRRSTHCQLTHRSSVIRQLQTFQTGRRRISEETPHALRPNIGLRYYQSNATEKPPSSNKPPPPPPPSTVNPLEPLITSAEERRSNWRIIKTLMVNVWPKNDWKTRGTVILGFGFLITGKVCVPLFPARWHRLTPLDCRSSMSRFR